MRNLQCTLLCRDFQSRWLHCVLPMRDFVAVLIQVPRRQLGRRWSSGHCGLCCCALSVCLSSLLHLLQRSCCSCAEANTA